MAKRKAAYHHGDLRRALMDAALATVAEGGVGGARGSMAARRYQRRPGRSTAIAGPGATAVTGGGARMVSGQGSKR